jgi:eukaryotic-like serine/threonine-protein kinase
MNWAPPIRNAFKSQGSKSVHVQWHTNYHGKRIGFLKETMVNTSAWARRITGAISLFTVQIIAFGCSTPVGSPQSALSPAPSAAFSTPTQVSARQPSSNGSMVRANVHGTGVYVTKGVRQLTGLKWKFTTETDGTITSPVIHGSTVYFSRQGRVYAVDAATGTETWNRKLENVGTSAPAVAGDTVYVGGWEELYALTIDKGYIRWSFRPEGGSDDSYYKDPAVVDGTVYFGSRKYFYALDIETRREKWKIKLSGTTKSVPTVYDGIVYVGTVIPGSDADAYLHALDTKTGQEKWKLNATRGGIGGAVAATGGLVYISSLDKALLALDAKSGQEKWRYNTGSALTNAPAVAHGMVYIINGGSLHALEALTGKEVWRVPVDGEIFSDPVIADGTIYLESTSGGSGVPFIGQPSGKLHAVDAQSGQELWTFRVEGIASSDPAVSDGTVYFGSEEGTLYAVK